MTFEESSTAMLSPDYKERMVAEYVQVQERANRLSSILDQWARGELGFKPTCPRRVLEGQLDAMLAYQSTLKERMVIEGIKYEE